MNVPMRAASPTAASPRDGRRTYPISADSICQFAPSVATKPKPIACGRAFGAGALSDCVVFDCAASVVDKAARATNIGMMDRRTFMLLTGAAALLPSRRPRPLRAFGNLRFDLDDQRRLTLWYNGPDRSVPLLRNAALGVWIGDTLATLADLEDVSVGNRRPPGGESLVIRGRTGPLAPAGTVSGSVWIEAQFFALDSEARGAITITVYPDRVLATIRGIRFFATSEPQVLPGDGPLIALVSGYQSWSTCRVTPLPVVATSFGAIGLTRAGHGIAAMWDPGEAGEGQVTLASDGSLDAVSEWRPGRPVRSDGDGATLRIAYLPAGDGLDALSAAATPASSVDRERVAALTVPTGWCSWYELGAAVTEADILTNVEFCAAHFDRRFFRYIQLDDGYQRAAGDWDTNARFPHGHRWLTDRIHAAGFQAGLWIAPFAVAEQSDVARTNPSWLLKGPPPAPEGTPLVMDTREPWGGRILALDGAHPGAQQWLSDLARRVVREWGYDYLKIDFLEWATGGVTHYGGLTRAEAYRSGLAALREGLGTEAFLLGCGAPLQQAAGLVDGMRIGEDVDASWNGIQSPARAAALRSFYHRSVWLNDPDCLVVRPPLRLEEARVWASVVAMSGGMSIFSDNLPTLPDDRLPILQKTIPVAAQTTSPARPVGTQSEWPEIVTDTGGPGGLWSVTRDRPASTWIVEGAPHWWTVALVNWDDEPRTVAQSLPSLGIAGARFAAYDVWAERPMTDVQQTLGATIPPHSTLVVALRPSVTRAQIIGSTRHIVQGAIDISDEHWDPATRTLRAKSVNLDGRPYAVTVAVPRGLRVTAGACKSDVACTVKRLESGHAVIEWPAGTTADLDWSVTFGSGVRR
jgi:melibiase-like protein